jgi:hypothetical protein
MAFDLVFHIFDKLLLARLHMFQGHFTGMMPLSFLFHSLSYAFTDKKGDSAHSLFGLPGPLH